MLLRACNVCTCTVRSHQVKSPLKLRRQTVVAGTSFQAAGEPGPQQQQQQQQQPATEQQQKHAPVTGWMARASAGIWTTVGCGAAAGLFIAFLPWCLEGFKKVYDASKTLPISQEIGSAVEVFTALAAVGSFIWGVFASWASFQQAVRSAAESANEAKQAAKSVERTRQEVVQELKNIYNAAVTGRINSLENRINAQLHAGGSSVGAAAGVSGAPGSA